MSYLMSFSFMDVVILNLFYATGVRMTGHFAGQPEQYLKKNHVTSFYNLLLKLFLPLTLFT